MEQLAALVVDDDPVMRRLLHGVLRKAGMSTIEAKSGEEAVAQCASALPDLILLDVEMRGMSGIEVCRHVRRLEGGTAVPVIMVTGRSDLASIERAYDAGASDFVTKPIDIEHLQRRILFQTRSGRLLRELHDSVGVAQSRQRRWERAQSESGIGYWECDLATDSVQISSQGLEILGLERAPATLAEFAESVVHESERPKFLEALRSSLANGETGAFEHRCGNSPRILRHHSVPSDGLPGEETLLALTVQDVTQQKNDEDRVRRLAFYDAVTGLPNRRFFESKLDAVIKRFAGTQDRVAVLFLDLDGFKLVNDRYGHVAGDEVLRLVAARLLSCVRGIDTVGRVDGAQGAVARFGGDEFVVLLTGLRTRDDAAACARRISEKIAAPLDVFGRQVTVGTSIGIAMYPGDGATRESLLRAADGAMYIAKANHSVPYRFCEAAQNQKEDRAAAILADLPLAAERGELHVVYQPRFALANPRFLGAEALVRWRHPELGEIPPKDFIGIAEQEGLIDEIGSLVLSTACSEASRWPDQRVVSVNVSRSQLANGQVAHQVFQALITGGLRPQQLEIEITESVMYESEQCLDQLRELEAAGVSLALDDFGAGYSSLSALVRFPIDVLKLDRSIIKDLDENADAVRVLRGVTRMAHDLGMRVVAEGVDRPVQVPILLEAGCDEAQGFLFSEPLASSALREFALSWDSGRRKPW